MLNSLYNTMPEPLSPAFEDSRTRVRWTIHALHVRQHAMLAVLSSVRHRVSDSQLADLVIRHIHETHLHIRRLRCVGQLMSIDFVEADDSQTLNELDCFARQLANGMLNGDVDSVAVRSLTRLAVVEHGLYCYTRNVCQELREFEIAALMLASEEEESHFIDQLTVYSGDFEIDCHLVMAD